MHKRITFYFLFIFFSLSHTAVSQKDPNNFIYSIRVTTTQNKYLIQTGFRLNGTPGIITALHGVTDAREITAVNENGNVYTNLKVIKVDIDKDAAILYSERMAVLPAFGLMPVNSRALLPHQDLIVLGHPQGIGLTVKSVSSGTPVIRKLQSLIPPGSASLFLRRNSPNPSIDVFYIEGNLVPGNSGSPVLKRGNVIGIVNGGLVGGAAGISWAIPITDLNFTNISNVVARFQNLRLPTAEEIFKINILTNFPSPRQRQYSVDFFKITGVRTVNRSYSLTELSSGHAAMKPISAHRKDSIIVLARDEIISLLKSDSSSRIISNVMKNSWDSALGPIIAFPTGTSINDLRRWTYEDAIERYSIKPGYDARVCNILHIDIAYRYSDYLNAYTGIIRNATIELAFVTPVCGPVRKDYYSQDDLESLQVDWTNFVVLKMDQIELEPVR